MGKYTSLCNNLLNSCSLRRVWQFNYFAFFLMSWSRVPLWSWQWHNPPIFMVFGYNHLLFHKDLGGKLWRSLSLCLSGASQAGPGLCLWFQSGQGQYWDLDPQWQKYALNRLMCVCAYVCLRHRDPAQRLPLLKSNISLAREGAAEPVGDKGSLKISHQYITQWGLQFLRVSQD